MAPYDISEEDYEAIKYLGTKELVNEVVSVTLAHEALHHKYKKLGALVRAQYGPANPQDLSKCGKTKLLSLREQWANVIRLGLSRDKLEALEFSKGECLDNKTKQEAKTKAKAAIANNWKRVCDYAYPPSKELLPSQKRELEAAQAAKKRKLEVATTEPAEGTDAGESRSRAESAGSAMTDFADEVVEEEEGSFFSGLDAALAGVEAETGAAEAKAAPIAKSAPTAKAAPYKQTTVGMLMDYAEVARNIWALASVANGLINNKSLVLQADGTTTIPDASYDSVTALLEYIGDHVNQEGRVAGDDEEKDGAGL